MRLWFLERFVLCGSSIFGRFVSDLGENWICGLYIPLTLAVICNVLKDALLGAIPFFIGDIIDIFNRSYVANLKLITGYVNDDKEVIQEVNKKAAWSAIFIVILCVLIYFIVKWVMELGSWFVSLF